MQSTVSFDHPIFSQMLRRHTNLFKRTKKKGSKKIIVEVIFRTGQVHKIETTVEL